MKDDDAYDDVISNIGVKQGCLLAHHKSRTTIRKGNGSSDINRPYSGDQNTLVVQRAG